MSIIVSLCILKIEIHNEFDELDKQTEGAMSTEKSKTFGDQRKSHNITVETYASKLAENVEKFLPTSSRDSTPLREEDATEEIGVFSGNPFVEVTKGVLHLYKQDTLTECSQGPSLCICLLAVPATLSCHDLLEFTASCHADIQHIRVVRDNSPNQYTVLITFRTSTSAMEFYRTFNGAPYNSLEPTSICHATWVSKVEWAYDNITPPGHTELPLCPVCLERMDESVDGVLTILCNHAFHSGCLSKWGDSTCPVCRCVQTPELTESSECMQCGGTEALWICLICGHVGCGRYQGGHAAAHFHSSNHTYAMQLGTNRVWDYAGDNFVHRLLQNKGDGKLVAAGGNTDPEKMDSLQLEFTYTLTSQLEAQREYYEEKLIRIEKHSKAETEELKLRVEEMNRKFENLMINFQSSLKEKSILERKLGQANAKLTSTQAELAEERHISNAFRNNQKEWQEKLELLEKRYEEKNTETQELKEQVRDLMFYMEAQNTIAKSENKDEIVGGSVSIGPSTSNNLKTKQRRRKS